MNKNALRISGFRDRARDTSGVTGNALALYRPAWEVRPAIWNLGAAAFASAAALSGNLPASWGILWGTGALLLSAWRWKEALAVWKRRAPLSGFEPLFMTMEDLVLRLREMSGRRLPEAARTGARFPLLLQSGGTGRTRHGSAFGEARNPRVLFLSQAEPRVENVWFGMGFPWTPVEAQKLEELSRVPRDVMTVPPGIRHLVTQDRGLSEKEIGSPILHGVGPGEAPIERPIRSLGGGTLLVGTTQAGKGVMLTSLIAQAILRGDAVIVIDPKSSKRLRGDSCRLRRCRARASSRISSRLSGPGRSIGSPGELDPRDGDRVPRDGDPPARIGRRLYLLCVGGRPRHVDGTPLCGRKAFPRQIPAHPCGRD